MRVLLLHPEDVPVKGQWANSRWDLIVDLGFAGASLYEEWGRQTGSRVITLHRFEDRECYRWVKRGLALGHGRLVDRMGLDWWEILAPCSYEEQKAIYLVEQLRQEIGSGSVELAATRNHLHATLLGLVMGSPVRVFEEHSSRLHPVSRIVSAAQNLRLDQIIEIAFDKWDPTYAVRSRLARHKRARLKESVTLLPSAYSNVTRTVLAYAAQLPLRRFLLATTRRGGESSDRPANVESVGLAAYAASSIETTAEIEEMVKAWNGAARELVEVEELRAGFRARLWDYIAPQLAIGLRLRDAWNALMLAEPVTGVLCGDDLNYHTRLPLIMAKHMGRKAIYCYHGALDGGLLFKKSYADVHLVKDDMERDYMLRAGEITPDRIEIAPSVSVPVDGTKSTAAGNIVVFSQPYEVTWGRAGEIYRDILGPLTEVARQLGRRIILKLHPFESVKGRRRLLKAVLSPEQLEMIRVSRAPASEVLAQTLLGIGLDSSVAMECVQRGIPYFACGWLDFNGFEYLAQFAKFGVAIVLNAPADILSIPQQLARFDRAKTRSCRQAADDGRLDQILFGANQVLTPTKCAC